MLPRAHYTGAGLRSSPLFTLSRWNADSEEKPVSVEPDRIFLTVSPGKNVIIWFLSIDVLHCLVYPHNASLNQQNAATSLHFTPVDWGD